MITKNFNDFVNENVSNKELLEEIRGSKYIHVDYDNSNRKWGVTYTKDGKTKTKGLFNTNSEVHEFLIENDIVYDGKEGYVMMKKYRSKISPKIPFSNYQKDLIQNGIEDLF